MLYKGVTQLVTENLDRLANEQVIPAFPTGDKNDVTQQSDERTQLLKALRGVWEDHQGNMSKLRDILKYLVR
jgi:cullin 3